MNPHFDKIVAAKGLAAVSRRLAADPAAVAAALNGPGGARLAEDLCRNIRLMADQVDGLANDSMHDKETIDWLLTKLTGGVQ